MLDPPVTCSSFWYNDYKSFFLSFFTFCNILVSILVTSAVTLSQEIKFYSSYIFFFLLWHYIFTYINSSWVTKSCFNECLGSIFTLSESFRKRVEKKSSYLSVSISFCSDEFIYSTRRFLDDMRHCYYQSTGFVEDEI